MEVQSPLSKSIVLRLLFLIQGAYYGLSGLWAIILPNNFIAVTGHGEAFDLDMASIAALAFVIGVIFLKASVAPAEHPLVVWLLFGSAVAVVVPELFFFSEVKNTLFFYDIFEEAAVTLASLPYFLKTLKSI